MVDVVNRDGLKFTETLCETLSQITLWPGITRSGLPSTPGQVENGKVRSGPLTWVVLDGSDAPSISDDEGTVTDLGHSRKRFRIEGELARDVMMRLAPLDFRDKAFADQAFKATTAHHMSVWIARDGAAWNIWVGYTFADAFREVLEETAAQWEDAYSFNL